jgi:hypothetical protein
MKIVDKRVPKIENKGKQVKDIKFGTVFTSSWFNHPEYKGPFMRVYEGIVDLNNPKHQWTHIDSVFLENYKELKTELHILGEIE